MPGVPATVLHAARGALVGAAVGETLGSCVGGDALPGPVLGGRGELAGPWGPMTEAICVGAEAVARGGWPALDAGPTEVVGAAIADVAHDRPPPLLADPDATDAYRLVSDLVAGRDPSGLGSEFEAIAEFARCGTFVDAVSGALGRARSDPDRVRVVTLAALGAGAVHGVTAIPSRWLTYVHGSGARPGLRVRDLLRLAERLVGFEERQPPPPRRRLGPLEVAEGVWASNIYGVRDFCDRHPDGAVVSMCPMGDRLDDFPVRRLVLLEDVPTRSANPHLAAVVADVVTSVAAFRGEGRQVLVHCHHGVSRTGLALRAWLMATEGLTEDQATPEVEARWPWLSTVNTRFTAVLGEMEARLVGSLAGGGLRDVELPTAREPVDP